MRVQTILKEEEGKRLIELCKENHISISAFLRSIVCQHLDSLEDKLRCAEIE